jgi:hypothetical protein
MRVAGRVSGWRAGLRFRLSWTEAFKRFTTAQKQRIHLRWKYALLKIAALISFLSFCLYPLTGGVKGEEATVAPYLFSALSLLVFLLPRRFLSVARGIALGQSALICLAGGQALIIGLASRQPDKVHKFALGQGKVSGTPVPLCGVCLTLNGKAFHGSLTR